MYLYAHNARIYAYIHVYRAKMEMLVYKLTEENMREKDIEKKLVDGIKRLGGCAYKWVSPGRDGVRRGRAHAGAPEKPPGPGRRRVQRRDRNG